MLFGANISRGGWLYAVSMQYVQVFIMISIGGADLFPVSRQDILLIRCSPDWISQNHVLASCRTVLRSQGIQGLSRAPCMAVFLERLPLLLQEQYNYERVRKITTIIIISNSLISDDSSGTDCKSAAY